MTAGLKESVILSSARERTTPFTTPTCALDECHLFASLLDETPQGVLIVNDEGLITHTNLAMSVMFLPVQVVPGERLEDLRGLEFIADLVKKARVSKGREEVDLQFSEGAGRYFHAVASPWKEDENQGLWVMVTDTTERAVSGQIRQEFADNAGNELRAPLSLIHGYIETLKSGMIKSPGSLQRCLEVMEKHSRRMMRVIDDMLTLARLESGSAPLRKEFFLTRGCVMDVLEHLTPLVEAHQPVITVDFPEDGGLLHGDRFYWDQIFTHLIENALRENPRSGLKLRIAGRWSRHECILTVEDDGIGFSAADIQMAFKHHHHGASDSRSGGLGLCIVKHAVEAHGGTLDLESVPAVRTVVTIRLPLPE